MTPQIKTVLIWVAMIVFAIPWTFGMLYAVSVIVAGGPQIIFGYMAAEALGPYLGLDWGILVHRIGYILLGIIFAVGSWLLAVGVIIAGAFVIDLDNYTDAMMWIAISEMVLIFLTMIVVTGGG